MKTFFGNGSGSNFGKIVAMDRFASGRSLSPIRQVEAYWTALLTGDSVPMRSQIDPRGLENILEYTFILERIAPSLARFRLAGSHLNNLAGMEVRGMPLTAFYLGASLRQPRNCRTWHGVRRTAWSDQIASPHDPAATEKRSGGCKSRVGRHGKRRRNRRYSAPVLNSGYSGATCVSGAGTTRTGPATLGRVCRSAK